MNYEAGLNFYSYVENEPTDLTDPTGFSAFCYFDQTGGIVCYSDSGGGTFSDPDAYSGYGQLSNNPAYQTVMYIGVIPLGYYWIGPPHNGDKGKPQFDLTPSNDPQWWTETFGRSRFLIHADSQSHPGFASEGCIVTSQAFRAKLKKEGGGILYVYNPKVRAPDALDRLLDQVYPRIRY